MCFLDLDKINIQEMCEERAPIMGASVKMKDHDQNQTASVPST